MAIKPLNITYKDACDAAVADIVRWKIELTGKTAAKDAEVARIEKQHQTGIVALQDKIAARELDVQAYSEANRSELFADGKKSRETPLAVFGFEITPPRVETACRKIKWADVLDRIKRTKWGEVYVRCKESLVKEALLADREKLSPEQINASGVQFCQDEQFFIRPIPETANLEPAAR
jgi:phage host-nuclease inhibitor protein Gam